MNCMSQESKIRAGRARFAVLALLKIHTHSLYELQKKLAKRDISADATRSNLRFLIQCGIARLHHLGDRKHAIGTNYYCLNEGVFCFVGTLLFTDPLCLFPCPYFTECNSDAACQFIHQIVISLRIPVQEVKRITEVSLDETKIK